MDGEQQARLAQIATVWPLLMSMARSIPKGWCQGIVPRSQGTALVSGAGTKRELYSLHAAT